MDHENVCFLKIYVFLIDLDRPIFFFEISKNVDGICVGGPCFALAPIIVDVDRLGIMRG